LNHRLEIEKLKSEYSEREAELKTKYFSIERRLGNMDFLAVEKLFGSQSPEVTCRVGDDVIYVQEGQFFAEQNEETWLYKRAPAYILEDEVRGKGRARQLPGHIKVTMEKSPIFSWKGKESYKIKGEASKWVNNLFPFITVESLSFDLLSERFKSIQSDSEFDENFFDVENEHDMDLLETDSDVLQDVPGLTTLAIAKFRSEAVGYIFINYLNTLAATSFSNKAVHFNLKRYKKQRLIPLSQVDQYLGLAGQIQNVAGFEFFGS
jgi:hypothetical protein